MRRCGAAGEAGFSLVEILACLLVLVIGTLSTVAMVAYGISLTNVAQGRATGMATAMSIAVDYAPLVPNGCTWSGDNFSAKGYVNGFYVTRTEQAGDPVPGTSIRTALVEVDVFETLQGRLVTSYRQRVIREGAP